MLLPDVNVLVAAHRDDADAHEQCRSWLDGVVNGSEAFAVSEIALSGFVRIVTHSRIFKRPTPLASALAFARFLHEQPHCVVVRPGDRHWEIFERLLVDARATGNLVPDAYHAALAIEGGCEWV